MDVKSEVVLRQQGLIKGATLLVNPPADLLWQQLQPTSPCSIWCWNYSHYLFFQNSQAPAVFDVLPPDNQPFEQVIIFVPKAKAQLNYLLNLCTALLGHGKQIFLVGEKKAGIEGAAKLLNPFGQVQKIDSARHCQLWQLTIAHPAPKFNIQDWIERYRIDLSDYFDDVTCSKLPSTQLQICALPGVFSQNGPDKGSAVLLPYLTEIRGTTVLDFGCGAGILGMILAVLNPDRTIYAVDIDAFALHSTALSFASNDLSSQLELKPVADIQDFKLKMNSIVSNPPFHQGVATDYQASENLCRYAASKLQRGGELWLVANRFLNYPTLLEQHFNRVTIETDTQGFKVIKATEAHSA